MNESQPEIFSTRLEVEHRNPLQIEIMRRMLRDRFNDPSAQLSWVMENGKRVSDVIDSPDNEEVRLLARQGNYNAAADQALALLEIN